MGLGVRGEVSECAICIHALIVAARVRWLIRDRTSIGMSQEAWISDLPLFYWPTFVSMEEDDHMQVCDLMTVDRRSWRIHDISRLFGSQLAHRILLSLFLSIKAMT